MNNQDAIEDVEHELALFRIFLETNYEHTADYEYRKFIDAIDRFLEFGKWTSKNDKMPLCAPCNGSGEGIYDGIICGVCRGKGSL